MHSFKLTQIEKQIYNTTSHKRPMKPFTPEKLPISGIDWETNAQLIGAANRAISRYDGLLQGIPDPIVMLSPLTSQEAVLSSKIEGTRATLGDVLQHDAGGTLARKQQNDDIYEIINYRHALLYGKGEIASRKFSLSILKSLHQILLASGRGENKNPGKFRTTQNWIGPPGSTLEEAFFVPPPPHVLQDHLDNFQEYYHSDRPDPLVQLAILHAQFEIIHPFDDGNGRLGRMLIPLFLYEKKVLTEPMFYLSSYLEKKREEYTSLLRPLGISPDAWNNWIRFFMRAIIDQAKENCDIVQSIRDLYDKLKAKLIDLTHSQFAVPILDYMFARGFFSSTEMSQHPNMPTRPQLWGLFKKIKQAGIVTVVEEGRGSRPEILMLPSLINICEGREVFYDPMKEQDTPPPPS
jgi:Uncharacterized conserved protein